jgi:menaquinone-specific isochorismate synthase
VSFDVSANDVPALVARTTVVEDPGSLLALLPMAATGTDLVSWVRRGEGLVGWGTAAVVRTSGATRFADAAKWWSEVVARASVSDAVAEPGSGLVSFGSLAFSDTPGDSVLVVPSVVVGRRGPTTWITTIAASSDATVDPAVLTARDDDSMVIADNSVTFADFDGERWMGAVADAVERINRGDLEKVVLARDLIATTTAPIDVRRPLGRLADTYPMCWTFHVDGLFGATPELLVRRERGLVTSRVLAGTIRRTGDDGHDLALAATLARSSKDLEEHEYAVRSVADALEPHCSSMNVPESPFVLHLPNVMHLATDVTAVLRDGVSSLGLAAALHPSAAVCGTPTGMAAEVIHELEQMDRERYAGPVGWLDADGDGEWGIALRSGMLDEENPCRIRLFAGCGIVAGSVPEAELAESDAKLLPLRQALGND